MSSRADSAPDPDRLAGKLRGFGPLGALTMLVITAMGPIIEPLGALLVLAWARRSRTPWSEIGFARPRSWIGPITAGIVFGAAFKIVMKAIVMPLLGADPVNQAYHYLAGNTAALPEMMFATIVGAGFGEEVVYRGYLFERLGKLFGSGAVARTAIVVLTSALFAAIHYPVQGLAGVEQAAVTGLVFGTIYALTGRLWTVMAAHAAFDVTAVSIIYGNLETYVAHLVFR
jgi:CAAX protease family protein